MKLATEPGTILSVLGESVDGSLVARDAVRVTPAPVASLEAAYALAVDEHPADELTWLG